MGRHPNLFFWGSGAPSPKGKPLWEDFATTCPQLVHNPLSQNATFYLKLRARKHDFFTPLSVRMLLFDSSFELRKSLTFTVEPESLIFTTQYYEYTQHMRVNIMSEPIENIGVNFCAQAWVELKSIMSGAGKYYE